MSQKGQVVLPAPVREALDLHPGDDFEIVLEDDGSIILRRVSKPPNAGLIDHLLNASGDLEIPERARDFAAPPNFEE